MPERSFSDLIISRLTTGYPVHSYSITIEESKEIFGEYIHYGREDKYKNLWEASKLWIKKYLDVESSNHIIDLFYRKNKGVAKMKKHLTDGEIKRIFTDPYSLKRGMKKGERSLLDMLRKRGKNYWKN